MSESVVSGAELVCATLARAGVDCVFGLPGTQTTGLYEALRRAPLRSIVATHELSAAMMANGYYRASGRLAALLTIPGPGFTWALTGLAEASLDSAALLHLTMQPARAPGRQFQLQALDQAIARHLGIEPSACKILALKSSVHFRADFQPIAERVLVASAPGPVAADSSVFPFRNLRQGLRLRPMANAVS